MTHGIETVMICNLCGGDLLVFCQTLDILYEDMQFPCLVISNMRYPREANCNSLTLLEGTKRVTHLMHVGQEISRMRRT